MSWTLEDHTADVCLAVEAASWPELLAEAARAFGEWTCGAGPPGARVERAVEVRGRDAIETWVRYWKTLHRLWAVEELLALDAQVEPDSCESYLRARVACRPTADLELERCADVKAVTWHGASAGPDADGRWRGRIILDV